MGIGQSLRRDDAAGLVVVKRWQELFPVHVRDSDLFVEWVELPGMALLDRLESIEQLLIVDAVQSGGQPGCLYRLSEIEVAAFVQGSDSAHGWGIAETLALGRRIQPERMPAFVDILGIEVKDVSFGEGLSAEVDAAIDAAAREIELWITTRGNGQGKEW